MAKFEFYMPFFNLSFRLKATNTPDYNLYPLERNAKDEAVTVNTTQFCSNTSGAPDRIYSVISKSSMVCIVLTQ